MGKHEIQNFNLHIELHALRIGKEVEGKEQLESLFTKIREGLVDPSIIESSVNKEIFKKVLPLYYKTKHYYIFGYEDLLTLSITDDFNFALRDIIPNKSEKKNGTYYYDNKILLSSIPKVNTKQQRTSLLKKIFLKNDYPFSLISVNHLKINDLFIGIFGDLFFKIIFNLLIKRLNSKFPGAKVDIILTRSYSWNEINLILFSNSFNTLYEANNLINQLVRANFNDGQLSQKKLSKIDQIESRFFHNLKPHLDSDYWEDYLNTPLFYHSKTKYGFDFEIFEAFSNTTLEVNRLKGIKRWNGISQDDLITPKCQWVLNSESKPHKAHIKKELKLKETDNLKTQISGENNILLQIFQNGRIINKITTKEFLKFLIATRSRRSIEDKIKSVSSAIFEENTAIHIFEPSTQQNRFTTSLFELLIENVQISREKEFPDLENQLIKLEIPKELQQNFFEYIHIFNRNITQQKHLLGIIDLYHFFHYCLEEINRLASFTKFKKEDGFEGKNRFKRILRILEEKLAYQHLKRLEPFSYNLEAKPGIKGSIFMMDIAFNGVFKTLARILGNRESILYISQNPLLEISDFSIRLHYTHLIYPERFAAVIMQEVGQQLPHKLNGKRSFPYSEKIQGKKKAKFNIERALFRSNKFKSLKWKKRKFEGLYDIITPDFLEHVYSDIIGFHLMYLKDRSLYLYWCWAYFSTISENYENGKPKTNEFLRFTMRKLLVLFCSTGFGEVSNSTRKNSINLDACSFENYSFQIPGISLVNSSSYINQIKKFISVYFAKSSDLGGWLAQVVDDANTLFRKTYHSSIYEHKQTINERSQQFKKSFKKHQPIYFQLQNHPKISKEKEVFIFTQSLILTYLQLIKEEAFKNASKGNGLINSSIKFTPNELVSTNDLELKSNLHFYRFVLIASLWDLAIKEKFSILQELIRR